MIAPLRTKYQVMAVVAGVMFSALPRSGVQCFDSLIIGATYYLTFSTTEWAIHRYILHSDLQLFGRLTNTYYRMHMKHHKNVHEDMKLKTTIAEDDGSGEFNWSSVILATGMLHLTTQSYMQKVWNIDPKVNITIVGASCLTSMWLWNNVHNSMHEDDKDVSWKVGPPRLFKSERAETILAPLFRVWERNHWLHHVIKARKTNFCTIFLGADKVWGTSPTAEEILKLENCNKKDSGEKSCTLVSSRRRSPVHTEASSSDADGVHDSGRRTFADTKR